MPRLALTPGDPAGIGPDIAVTYAQRNRSEHVVAFCCPQVLRDRADTLGLPLRLEPYDFGSSPPLCGPAELSYVALSTLASVTAGEPNPANARYVLDCLDRAFEACESGLLDGMVTGPISKQLINDGLGLQAGTAANVVFTGHTEYLRDLAKVEHVVMLLAVEHAEAFGVPLRVALVTTHVPIAELSATITGDLIARTLRVLQADLVAKYAIEKPRILVCGLNPHAGEGGLLGAEEERVINPCLMKLQQAGMDVSLAMPADTIFTEPHLRRADAVLAMYHDQGLAPLKSHGFGKAVNITLGLPVIRTSVDHGTAFDIAGSGRASAQSLVEAIATADALAQRSAGQRN